MFDPYLILWSLTPDGKPMITHSSRLLPVRYRDQPAMLKIAVEPEEKFGGSLMTWWNGDGAARVLAHEDDALLLERAEGAECLVSMARSGANGDAEAIRILCRAVAKLHAPRATDPPPLIPLMEWFRDLEPAAAKYGGILRRSKETAGILLGSPQDVVVLHGDIHHGNVLNFGAKGWLVIDPKRLHGERGFDYANILMNPDDETATAPGRMLRMVRIISEEADIDRRRLLQWILAWAGLSAAWSLGDGDMPHACLTIAETAAVELDKD